MYVQIFLRWSWTWSSLAVEGNLLSHSLPWGPSKKRVWEERLPVKTEVKKLLSTSAFSSAIVTRLMVGFIREWAFSDPCFLSDIAVEAFLCILDSSCCALTSLTPSLHKQSELYTLPRRLVSTSTSFSFLPFSLTRRPWLNHTSLLSSFLNFVHMNIKSSCIPWKTSLSVCQLCSAPLSQKVVSQRVLLTDSLNNWNYTFVKFRMLTLLFTWCISLRTKNSNSAWILQLRTFPVVLGPINSLVLETIRSSIVSHLIGLSISWLNNLSSTLFRNLLDCL